MNLFTEFGLLASLEKTLKEKRLFKPTEIQSQTIPLLMSGQSVVGVSETGSGKTLAYALPLLNLLKSLEESGEPIMQDASPRAVILVPTRELGEQVSKVFKEYTHDTRLRVRPALGGMTLEHAKRNVSGNFEILIATPGRLVLMIEKEFINLKDVRLLVFDEADQMMDQGFLPDSNYVVSACKRDLQMALFSATVSTAVQELMNNLFSAAEVIRSKGSGKVVSSLVTKNLIVDDGKRWPLFERVLAQKVEGGTIVFTNTREQCDKVAKELTDHGYVCAVYRGEMDKNERRQSLKRFRDGKVDLLVSTDLAGRGLDISNVGRVINYHLPKEMENYLHRAGRTARAGRKGVVVNLVTERDSRLMARLEGNKTASLEKRMSAGGGKPRTTGTASAQDSREVGGRRSASAHGSRDGGARNGASAHRSGDSGARKSASSHGSGDGGARNGASAHGSRDGRARKSASSWIDKAAGSRAPMERTSAYKKGFGKSKDRRNSDNSGYAARPAGRPSPSKEKLTRPEDHGSSYRVTSKEKFGGAEKPNYKNRGVEFKSKPKPPANKSIYKGHSGGGKARRPQTEEDFAADERNERSGRHKSGRS